MLANLLKMDERVNYIGEPKYIWKYKNFSAGHDKLTKDHITPEIQYHIRNTFQNYLTENGGDILLEKTPSNSLRFEFVYNLFPKAKFIHIIRNGIDVAFSAKKRWCGEYTKTEKVYKSYLKEISSATKRRSKRRWLDTETRFVDMLLDLNYIIPLYMNNMGLLKHSIWGPVYPGIRQDYKNLDLIEVCALQWKHSVDSVLDFKNSSDFRGDYFEIRYEDIVEGNFNKIMEMFEFSGICMNIKSKKYLQTICDNYQKKTYSLNPGEKEKELILKHSQNTLTSLGYS